MNAVRPLPEPSALSRPFWDASSRRELIYPQCNACSRGFFPPQLCCPRCRSLSWRWQASAGAGTVYSHTVVHRAPQPGFDPPYVLAVVDLDDGFELMTNVVGVDPSSVRIGMRVQVDWLEVADQVLPVFVPLVTTPQEQR